MNRRGDVTVAYVLTWIVFTCLMLVVIFGSLLFWIDGKLNPPVKSYEAESVLVAERLLYSPNALGYLDPLADRAMPGIVDGAKLATGIEPQLLNAIASDQEYGAKIVIGSITLYYNQAIYDSLRNNRAQTTTLKTVVLVRQDGKDVPTQATIDVLRRLT
ncbi:hypothetical protein HY492_00310 [Candidatus Woesearchaeota archaeon]|nr:hypothetical protein [Candidatus Woesearchaeota archaeon]